MAFRIGRRTPLWSGQIVPAIHQDQIGRADQRRKFHGFDQRGVVVCHVRIIAATIPAGNPVGKSALIDVYWASNSPHCWSVLLALELKRQPWRGHLLNTDLQEHKAPHMLAMNPRGRLPVLRDGDYVVFETLAVLYYLDLKYPAPPLFGHSPEEAAVIMRVINEFQAYTEEGLLRLVRELQAPAPAPGFGEALTRAMYYVAGEARTIEGRLSKGD